LYYDASRAIEHALQLLDDGADILDIGGESSRSGAAEIPVEEELRRVIPVIEGILAANAHVQVSIDTVKYEVAEAALRAGARIINDISGLSHDVRLATLAGEYDAGLIIHESRFTYQQRGLTKLMDLGDWWEQTTHAAIPLGGIVIRRSIDKELCATVDNIIKESLAYSWRHYPELSSFVTENAQEMEEEVMRKHINLYVNDYTKDLGDKGRSAIATLFEKAEGAGLLDEGKVGSIFY